MLIKKERTAEKTPCNFILNIFKYMVCTGKQKNIKIFILDHFNTHTHTKNKKQK